MDPLESDVQFFPQALAQAVDDDPDTEDAARSSLMDMAEDMERKVPGRGVAVWKRATGEITGTLDHLDEWLAPATDTEKSKDMKRADVRRLARKFPTTREIGRKEVRRWGAGLIQNEGLKATTVARLLSSCRGYWRFLQAIEIVPDESEPFDRLRLPKVNSGRNKADERQPFEPKDVVRLLRAAEAKGDPQLADLIRLAMWTGARAEELCSLRVENVSAEGYFDIESAKTKAGLRRVPIHPELKATMDRLCKDSKDGYVLTGLTADKHGDRRCAIGIRFGNLKKRMGFDKTRVFHSLRHTVYTLLENAEVQGNVISDIVGHAGGRSAMSRTYSGGATLETKRAALAKLSYPSSP